MYAETATYLPSRRGFPASSALQTAKPNLLPKGVKLKDDLEHVFMILWIALLFAAAVSAPFVIGVWTFIIEPILKERRARKLEAKKRKRRERMLSNLHRADTDDDSDEPAWLKR